jgi:methionyl-tRNA formyltransferase
MNNILVATNGSQGIDLIRELFALKFKPHQIMVLTDQSDLCQNRCFLEFLKYYKITHFYTLSQAHELIDGVEVAISLSCRIIFPREIIIKPRHFINFHPGLLPDFRGSNSTVHALAMGYKTVGGTWHRVTEKVDKGPVLNINMIRVEDDDTAFSLNHKIFKKGIAVLSSVLSSLDSYEGYSFENEGNFFFAKDFPNFENTNLTSEMKKRILYFPPKFNDYEF